MGYLPSLPEQTNLSDVLKAYPKGVEPLLRYHDDILRGPSPFTIGERELIAAYVSATNGCEYCTNAHTMYAETYGFDAAVIDGMIEDLATSDVPDRMKPVLAYAGKLTSAPGDICQGDVDAILDAGWSEEAVADTVYVTAIFNFMNRVIMGTGVAPFGEDYEARKARIRKRPLEKRLALNDAHLGNDHYMSFGRAIGLIED